MLLGEPGSSQIKIQEAPRAEDTPTITLPAPKRRHKPPSFPPPPAPRPSLVVPGAPSMGVSASLLSPALSSLPSHYAAGLSPPSSPRPKLTAHDESLLHSRSPSIDFSARKVSSGSLITSREGSLALLEHLPVTSELSPSYLVIENRKDSFASEYEVNRKKATSSKLIDASKLRQVSEEDLRTLLTFFPVSGSDSGAAHGKSQQSEKTGEAEPHASGTLPRVWPPGTEMQEAPKPRKFPREKLPPRPMVQIQPVKPVLKPAPKSKCY